MNTYKVHLGLFDIAVFCEFRIQQRFIDIDAAEEFKEKMKEVRLKIVNDTISSEELLQVAELIKHHCD